MACEDKTIYTSLPLCSAGMQALYLERRVWCAACSEGDRTEAACGLMCDIRRDIEYF